MSTDPALSPRVLRMLEDLTELRKSRWGLKPPAGARRWTCRVRKSDEGSVGLGLAGKVYTTRFKMTYLVIREVIDGGVLAKFNQENPTEAIQPGDRIVGMNGFKGDPKVMIQQMRSGVDLVFDLERVDGEDADASQ